jgi:thioredoxin-dependent peroxiredoxin
MSLSIVERMTPSIFFRRFALSATFALMACACAKSPNASSGAASNVVPSGSGGDTAAKPVAAEFTAKDASGASVKLQDLRGSLVVLYFYPKDDTPGCTKEACAFRDAFAEYGKRGIKIVGVSQDSEESHKLFRTKHQLPFPLVADTDGSVSKAYGVGSTFGMSSRVTFLIDRDGKIAHSWPNVDPGVHSQEVLAFASTLK